MAASKASPSLGDAVKDKKSAKRDPRIEEKITEVGCKHLHLSPAVEGHAAVAPLCCFTIHIPSQMLLALQALH